MSRAWSVIGCALALLAGSLAAADDAGKAAPLTPQSKLAVVIPFQGPIMPGLERFLERKLALAEALGAETVVLEIDSPGGRLLESTQISTRMRNLGFARSVAYIPRQSLSGAAIVSLGCGKVVIGSSGRIGDAGPIYMDQFGMFQHAEEKVRSDLVADVRRRAEEGSRPPAIAEAMVDRSVVVWKVRDPSDGKTTFLTKRELDGAPEGKWEKIEVVDESNRGLFLTVVGQRAVDVGVADALANDQAELEALVPAAKWIRLEPTNTDVAVEWLTSWLIGAVLILIGLIGIGCEFAAPGTMVGGMVGALCFGLFFWARFVGGTAGTFEVVLLVAGVAFLAVELFLLPGFGLAGVLGILLIGAGVVLASVEFIAPRGVGELTELAWQIGTFVAVLMGVFLGLSLIFHQIESVPLLRRLVLAPPGQETPDSPEADEKAPAEGPASVVSPGDWGVSASPLRPMGKARFAGRLVDVASDGDFIVAGAQIRVVAIDGHRVIVQAVDAEG